MPLPPEDILKLLVDATTEAKQATRELHEAQKTARTIVKEQKERIAMAIKQEVSEQVEALGDDASLEMREFLDQTIKGIAADWRAKLGLD